MKSFLDFAIERHRIYLRRQDGMRAPWTNDAVLQKYRFTNVYRELDRVTEWFKKHRSGVENTLLATPTFRLFNRTEVGEVIFEQPGLETNMTPYEHFLLTGDSTVMKQPILAAIGKGPYTTGAYIINSPNGMNKLDGVLWMIQQVYNALPRLESASTHGTMQNLWSEYKTLPHIAAFTAYEFVCDLRYTDALEATDRMDWANAGPGAMRGLNRLHDRPLKYTSKRHDWSGEIKNLLAETQEQWPEDWPALEMREIEHTLCEYDKYVRTWQGEGRPRGTYP